MKLGLIFECLPSLFEGTTKNGESNVMEAQPNSMTALGEFFNFVVYELNHLTRRPGEAKHLKSYFEEAIDSLEGSPGIMSLL